MHNFTHRLVVVIIRSRLILCDESKTPKIESKPVRLQRIRDGSLFGDKIANWLRNLIDFIKIIFTSLNLLLLVACIFISTDFIRLEHMP